MGLAEKRMLAELRDAVVPRYEAELRTITGNDIRYVIDWDSFADQMRAMANLEAKCLQPIATVFSQITKDDLGKEAVSENIHEIHLSQGKEAYIPGFTLVNGVLNMPWDWEGWSGSFFPGSVQEKIESML